jgi:hypothetical protein
MKNKKLLYILIPAVGLIWGLVIYTILTSVRGSNELSEAGIIIPDISGTDTLMHSYELLANYRDPFLRYSAVVRENKETTPAVKPGNVRNQRETASQQLRRVIWPGIEYRGLILSEGRNVALLRINNSNVIMSEGQSRNEVKLLKMYADSVQLSLGTETKYIVKSSIN